MTAPGPEQTRTRYPDESGHAGISAPGLAGVSSGGFFATGDNGHELALRSNGTALAWGANGAGQLGVGDAASHIGPVEISGLADASQVAARNSYSLAVYLPPQLIQS